MRRSSRFTRTKLFFNDLVEGLAGNGASGAFRDPSLDEGPQFRPSLFFLQRGGKQLFKRLLPDGFALKRSHGFKRFVLLFGEVDGQAAHGDPLAEADPHYYKCGLSSIE
jgi:hypothetical protein